MAEEEAQEGARFPNTARKCFLYVLCSTFDASIPIDFMMVWLFNRRLRRKSSVPYFKHHFNTAEPISTALAIFAPCWPPIVSRIYFKSVHWQQPSMNPWNNEAEVLSKSNNRDIFSLGSSYIQLMVAITITPRYCWCLTDLRTMLFSLCSLQIAQFMQMVGWTTQYRSDPFWEHNWSA